MKFVTVLALPTQRPGVDGLCCRCRRQHATEVYDGVCKYCFLANKYSISKIKHCYWLYLSHQYSLNPIGVVVSAHGDEPERHPIAVSDDDDKSEQPAKRKKALTGKES